MKGLRFLLQQIQMRNPEFVPVIVAISALLYKVECLKKSTLWIFLPLCPELLKAPEFKLSDRQSIVVLTLLKQSAPLRRPGSHSRKLQNFRHCRALVPELIKQRLTQQTRIPRPPAPGGFRQLIDALTPRDGGNLLPDHIRLNQLVLRFRLHQPDARQSLDKKICKNKNPGKPFSRTMQYRINALGSRSPCKTLPPLNPRSHFR